MKFTPLWAWLAMSTLLHAAPQATFQLQANGSNIIVEAGEAVVNGTRIKITGRAVLPIAPAPILTVEDEPVKLSMDKPAGFAKGTKLKGCNARDVNAAHSLVPGSLEIRLTKRGELLKPGVDYLVDEEWAMVGLGLKSRVTANDTVYASYRYSQLRLDTLQVSADGRASLKQGEPHISSPLPPAADTGSRAIAHVLINYRATGIAQEDIYPILETSAQAVTGTTKGRIPKTLAKLKAGQPVTIVCWGDSVTAGGNASAPEHRYVDVFAAGLRKRFPKAQIDVKNVSAGGSNSRHWLFPEKFPYRGLQGDANPAQFKHVLAAKPDLVTIEFVNDAGLTAPMFNEVYTDILNRLGPDTEVILITPHFTMWKMMQFNQMRDKEARPYVLALREFAAQKNLGLADAAARWEHLWKEGLPYLTLLHNTINHPDDRGHLLFAEELWKCFE